MWSSKNNNLPPTEAKPKRYSLEPPKCTGCRSTNKIILHDGKILVITTWHSCDHSFWNYSIWYASLLLAPQTLPFPKGRRGRSRPHYSTVCCTAKRSVFGKLFLVLFNV